MGEKKYFEGDLIILREWRVKCMQVKLKVLLEEESQL